MWSEDRSWWWNGERWLTPAEKKAEDADRAVAWGIPALVIGGLVFPFALAIVVAIIAMAKGYGQ